MDRKIEKIDREIDRLRDRQIELEGQIDKKIERHDVQMNR